MKTKTVQSDVLVIGGGLAGIEAALHARRAGASVCMVLKGRLGTSGNSALAGGGFTAALALADPQDNVDVHFADSMAGGSNINSAALVRALVERSPEAILDLQRMGVIFATTPDGKISQVRAPAQTYRRGVRTAGGGTAQMMEVLTEAINRAGVEVVENTTISDLLVQHGAAVGAVGYLPPEDAMLVFQARAVVLAAGGLGQMFPVTSNHPEQTGDAYAMAYRAGLRLADMEFVQFTPTALAYPPGVRGTSAGGSILGQEGVKLLNRHGERFMTRYDPERMERTTRAIASRAMYREIVEGRGTEHGGVYLDATEVDPVALENISGTMIRRVKAYGIDPSKDRLELAPAVHHFMGGVVMDGRCRTDIRGLFAAGEAAAGVHGANRLNSNALSEAAVFGLIAGEEAATYASATAQVALDPRQVERARADLEAQLKPGEDAEPFVERLRTVMLAGAGLERRGPDIEAAQRDLERLRREAEAVGASDGAALCRAIELRNMLQIGEVMMKAALMRTESRGAHYRDDYPKQNDGEWLANIVISRGEAGPVLRPVPVAK